MILATGGKAAATACQLPLELRAVEEPLELVESTLPQRPPLEEDLMARAAFGDRRRQQRVVHREARGAGRGASTP